MGRHLTTLSRNWRDNMFEVNDFKISPLLALTGDFPHGFWFKEAPPLRRSLELILKGRETCRLIGLYRLPIDLPCFITLQITDAPFHFLNVFGTGQ